MIFYLVDIEMLRAGGTPWILKSNTLESKWYMKNVMVQDHGGVWATKEKLI
jgi:hypothetical protein